MDIVQLNKDYADAVPANNWFLMSYYNTFQMPEQGSLEYYQFLSLLKFLECYGIFNSSMLTQFI